MDQLFNGVLGNAALVILILLGIAWFMLPIWVWSIRDNMKRHIEQQGRVLQAIERLERQSRQEPRL